jgi:hypothetical protein
MDRPNISTTVSTPTLRMVLASFRDHRGHPVATNQAHHTISQGEVQSLRPLGFHLFQPFLAIRMPSTLLVAYERNSGIGR